MLHYDKVSCPLFLILILWWKLHVTPLEHHFFLKNDMSDVCFPFAGEVFFCGLFFFTGWNMEDIASLQRCKSPHPPLSTINKCQLNWTKKMWPTTKKKKKEWRQTTVLTTAFSSGTNTNMKTQTPPPPQRDKEEVQEHSYEGKGGNYQV